MNGDAPNGVRNIALILEYDGRYFHGWQSQIRSQSRLHSSSPPDASAAALPTVQDAVCDALRKLDGAPPRLIGAGRTDAGVHARGQVANFITRSRIPAAKYAYALNTVLPAGVSCVGSFETELSFNARFSAKSKVYSYTILNRRLPSALYRYRAWHVPLPLDVASMREAALLFIGEHDFRAFMSAGSPVKSTIRNVIRLDIEIVPDAQSSIINLITAPDPDKRTLFFGKPSFIRLTIEGNGFLYNMVRIITGTLVYVGQGRLGLCDVANALASGGRASAGKTAPPHGLCLEYVNYG